MVYEIIHQYRYFLMCIFVGFILALYYDGIRIIRNIIKHSRTMIVIEDIFYGILSGIGIFVINFVNNNGSVRIYVFWGIIIGVIIYLKIFSKAVINSISSFLLFFKEKICFLLRIVPKITINKNISSKKISKFRKL